MDQRAAASDPPAPGSGAPGPRVPGGAARRLGQPDGDDGFETDELGYLAMWSMEAYQNDAESVRFFATTEQKTLRRPGLRHRDSTE